jgi:YggT family protein
MKDALDYIVDSVLRLAVYAFLLRFLLPLVRADFRNPVSQAILSMTSWLVLPLRRVLPPMGRVDTASLVALLAVQITATLVMFLLRVGVLMPFGLLIQVSMTTLAIVAIWFYIFLIVVNALLSFIAPGTYSPVVGLLSSLCEPLLRPIRRILPAVGGLDFSPLVAIVTLRALLFLIP